MTSYYIPSKGHIMNLANEATRAWIYRVITAALPLLTAYGVVADEQVPLIVALVAAILGTGLAARNTTV
jgi:hypothetical protein